MPKAAEGYRLISGKVPFSVVPGNHDYDAMWPVEPPKGPDGKLYTPDMFNVINWNTEGTAMLQDAIWANSEKLKDAKYADQTQRFVNASIQGWVFCRDNADRRAALPRSLRP